jgi:type I restriction enzyme S subunit
VKKIALSSLELNIIQNILANIKNVIIFGSRIKGTSFPFSDLDICIKDKLSAVDFELLKEKFENSDLPFMVDLVEYDRADKTFQKIIDTQGIDLKNIINKE